MDPINPKNLWIESLFDVSEPYMYAVVLVPLILFAVGMRRMSVLSLFGASAFFTVLGAA